MNTETIMQLGLAIAVNGFIVAYLVFAWSWNLPAESFLKLAANKLGRPLFWLGLSHCWAMFSPNPMRVNFRLLADVHLENGETIRWAAPQFERMGKLQAFLRVRERKLYEQLLSDRFSYLKPAFAEYLANHVRARGLRPLKIVLKCSGESIPDLMTGESAPFETRTVFAHRVC